MSESEDHANDEKVISRWEMIQMVKRIQLEERVAADIAMGNAGIPAEKRPVIYREAQKDLLDLLPKLTGGITWKIPAAPAKPQE